MYYVRPRKTNPIIMKRTFSSIPTSVFFFFFFNFVKIRKSLQVYKKDQKIKRKSRRRGKCGEKNAEVLDKNWKKKKLIFHWVGTRASSWHENLAKWLVHRYFLCFRENSALSAGVPKRLNPLSIEEKLGFVFRRCTLFRGRAGDGGVSRNTIHG